MKVWFSSWIDTLLNTILCITSQLWTSFKIPTKSWKKSRTLSFEQKKRSRIHKECLHKFFWLGIFTTNTLSTNVHKIYECDKIQVPYKCNVKNFKKNQAIDRTWPTLDKFYYFYLHKWKKKYFRGLYKIWNKIIIFYMKKRGNLRQIIRKMKKKVNLKVFRVSPYVSKGVPQSCFDLLPSF